MKLLWKRSPAENLLFFIFVCFTAEEVLRRLLPVELPNVTGFETIGHIAHLNLRVDHLPFKSIIGQVLLDVCDIV